MIGNFSYERTLREVPSHFRMAPLLILLPYRRRLAPNEAQPLSLPSRRGQEPRALEFGITLAQAHAMTYVAIQTYSVRINYGVAPKLDETVEFAENPEPRCPCSSYLNFEFYARSSNRGTERRTPVFKTESHA